MFKNKMTPDEMIRWLGDAIRVETEKPFEDVDYDFVDECGKLLDTLMVTTALTEQEIREKVKKLQKKTASSTHRIPKRPLRILIAAAIVLVMGISVMAVPFTRQYIASALHLDTVESSVVDGITCLYNGTEKTYPSAEAFMESEGIHFSLPHATSDKYAVQKIVCAGDTNIVVLQLADPSIYYEIWIGDNDIEAYTSEATEYHFGKNTTYIVPKDTYGITTYYSYTLIGDDIHCITFYQLEGIEDLISSID